MCVIVKTERRIKRGGRGSKTLIVRHVNVSTCHATAGLMRFPDDFSRVWVRVPRRDDTVGATRCRDDRWCGRVPPSFWVWRAAVCWCPPRSFARAAAAVGPLANRPRSPRAPGRTCPATITWTWTGCWKTTSWWRRTSSVSWTRDTAPRKPNKSKVGTVVGGKIIDPRYIMSKLRPKLRQNFVKTYSVRSREFLTVDSFLGAVHVRFLYAVFNRVRKPFARCTL